MRKQLPTLLAAPPQVLPHPLARQFCAFACAPIPPQPALPCNRRDYYKLALFGSGRSRLHCGPQSWAIEGPALVCCSRQVLYTWQSFDEQAGRFCEFAEEFVLADERAGALRGLPLFTLEAAPVLPLTAGQHLALAAQLDQLMTGLESPYAFKYELLRHQLHALLYHIRQLLPPSSPTPPLPATNRLTAQFLDLLERQFPIHTPAMPLGLRSAQDYALRLGVHVNHLNRSVRAATGQTTTAHLTARLVLEAQALLQYTDWSIADIAHALGFDYLTYFHNFVKKHTGCTPQQVRAAAGNV